VTYLSGAKYRPAEKDSQAENSDLSGFLSLSFYPVFNGLAFI
jgi:hypothetical protein